MPEQVDPKDVIARRRQLLEQARSSPIVEVVGVVGPRGSGGGKVGREDMWTLRCEFAAWRLEGGEVQTGALTICREVSDGELRRLMASMKRYAILRVRARVAEDEKLQTAIALLDQVVEKVSGDRDLERIAARLQEPVTYTDPTFGVLTLDRRIDTYAGEANWRGRPVKLFVTPRDSSPGEVIRVAHELWKTEDTWDARIRDCAVRGLLELKNDSWLSEDEQPVTEEEFRTRMELAEVSVSPGDAFTFWFHDGDLFWGHVILVTGNLQDGPKDAEIAG